jgi:hypothetical protein
VIHCLESPARVAPVFVSLVVSLGFFAACGEPAEATLVMSEAHALEACETGGCDATDAPDAATSDAATADADAVPEQGGWVSRCVNDGECGVGQCVCGVCTESCNGEADACSGLPDGATCFGGRSLPRAALCHATTVPGICLAACETNDECGEGLVCALGACLPEPESSAH